MKVLRTKMSNDLIDISLSISTHSVVWPSSPQPKLGRRLSIENGDLVNDSNLFMNVHTGTHIDSPLHHFSNGVGADEITLESMVGEAWVLDFTGIEDISLESLAKNWPSKKATRILLKTRNSEWWEEGRENFVTDYTALMPDTAKWLVDQGVKLIGIDYLSVQRYHDPPTVHRVLLQAGVTLLEGLNLYHVQPGKYELLCLPLKLSSSDGAPARAILRRL